MGAKMPNLTSKLARHSVGYRRAQLDAPAVKVAKQCILDWFGVTLAGLDEPVARILRDEIAKTCAVNRRLLDRHSSVRQPTLRWSTAEPHMRSTMTTFTL